MSRGCYARHIIPTSLRTPARSADCIDVNPSLPLLGDGICVSRASLSQ